MASIIRLTTPTIKYGFKVVKVSDIAKAYLTIKQDGTAIIEKDLNDATVGEKDLSWRFSQEETKLMSIGKITAMINWLLNDGTRGASGKTVLLIDGNFKDEVI